MFCRQRHRGPMAVVVEAPGGMQRLQHNLPVLGELPCCEVPAHSGDSSYPSLAWQQRSARVAVQRAAAAGSWLKVGLSPRPAASLCVALHELSCSAVGSDLGALL